MAFLSTSQPSDMWTNIYHTPRGNMGRWVTTMKGTTVPPKLALAHIRRQRAVHKEAHVNQRKEEKDTGRISKSTKLLFLISRAVQPQRGSDRRDHQERHEHAGRKPVRGQCESEPR